MVVSPRYSHQKLFGLKSDPPRALWQCTRNPHGLKTSHISVYTITSMDHKKDAGPPPLEDPNSPDYVCGECHNKVNALCLQCLEMAPRSMDYVCDTCHNKVTCMCQACHEVAQMRANFIKNARDNSDLSGPQPMPDTDRRDSTYDVDIISDSSISSDTNLNIDYLKNFDEYGTVLVQNRNTMNLFQRKSFFLDGTFDRYSDTTETDYSDMPTLEQVAPLEQTNKAQADSHYCTDDMPPVEDN